MPAKLIKLASEIVSAFVLNNNVHASEVSGLIHSVYTAVAMANEPPIEIEPQNAMPTHYQINKSIRNDGLVSFIDGKSYKTLGRHITAQGMSIEEYKRTFGLPLTYPMSCQDYSVKRSEIAIRRGLGRKTDVHRKLVKTNISPSL